MCVFEFVCAIDNRQQQQLKSKRTAADVDARLTHRTFCVVLMVDGFGTRTLRSHRSGTHKFRLADCHIELDAHIIIIRM